MMSHSEALASVREYYGTILKSNKDLQSTACCTAEAMPPALRPIAAQIHPEVLEKFYGCGSPLPAALDGATVLDLGSGSGRDCFILSKLVGQHGRVIGVDMTPNQIAVARKHIDYHMKQFGYNQPNVEFREGLIEGLAEIGVADNSIDVVVSNCVLNLSPDKERVFKEIFRVLKPGGELYFSDVFASRRIPRELARDPLLLGECLGGAFYFEDLRRTLSRAGCDDARVMSRAPIALTSPAVVTKVGKVAFESATIRAFKLALEDRCEDYGQVAYYNGTIPDNAHRFVLDDHHTFETGRPMLICGNTAMMISATRYREHFRVVGNTNEHFGLFDCSPTGTAGSGGPSPAGACC